MSQFRTPPSNSDRHQRALCFRAASKRDAKVLLERRARASSDSPKCHMNGEVYGKDQAITRLGVAHIALQHPGRSSDRPSFVGPLNQSPNQGATQSGLWRFNTRVGPCRRDRAQTPTSLLGRLKFGPWFHCG
jgi:hypothetical protein